LSRNVVDNGTSRSVGNKKHLKLTINQQQDSSLVFAGIAFQKGDDYMRVHSKEPFSICYCIEKNFWQGKTNLQLNVKDIKFSNEMEEIGL
jgi:single-stranded-DNA-specific exonuclease